MRGKVILTAFSLKNKIALSKLDGVRRDDKKCTHSIFNSRENEKLRQYSMVLQDVNVVNYENRGTVPLHSMTFNSAGSQIL